MTQPTIPELIERRADEQPDDTAYTFYDYESDPAGVADTITWSELRDRVGVVAEQLAKLGSPGERAVVLAPQGLDYIVGFLGAIRAGFIAVPLSVPQAGQHDERVTGAMGDSTPVAVLTTSAVVDEVRNYTHAQSSQRPPKVIEIDALDFFSPAKPPVLQDAPKIAYLQYTSGSTRRPAGVSITHTSLQIWIRRSPTISRHSTFRRGNSPWCRGRPSITTWGWSSASSSRSTADAPRC
jgi:long chain fatty acid CoA FadD26